MGLRLNNSNVERDSQLAVDYEVGFVGHIKKIMALSPSVGTRHTEPFGCCTISKNVICGSQSVSGHLM